MSALNDLAALTSLDLGFIKSTKRLRQFRPLIDRLSQLSFMGNVPEELCSGSPSEVALAVQRFFAETDEDQDV